MDFKRSVNNSAIKRNTKFQLKERGIGPNKDLRTLSREQRCAQQIRRGPSKKMESLWDTEPKELVVQQDVNESEHQVEGDEIKEHIAVNIEQPISIDGSIKEGGGQIIRNCISLSALLNRPIIIKNIRAGRASKGLKVHDLAGIQLIRNMYNGQIVGDEPGSSQLAFSPSLFSGSYFEASYDTPTSGAITLLIQIALPCLIFAPNPVNVALAGGTNVGYSPQIDYTVLVFQPIAKLFGIDFDIDIKKRGYFPKGGGKVLLKTKPIKFLKPINLMEQGNVTQISIRAFVSGSVNLSLAQQTAQCSLKILDTFFNGKNIKFETEVVKEQKAHGNGTGIMIVAHTDTGCVLGSSVLGEKGKTAEKVGTEAAKKLISNIQKGGCVDDFMQDQVILFCALAKGTSMFKCGPITLHAETSIYFCQLLTGAKFTITKIPIEERKTPDERSYIITCEGIEYST